MSPPCAVLRQLDGLKRERVSATIGFFFVAGIQHCVGVYSTFGEYLSERNKRREPGNILTGPRFVLPPSSANLLAMYLRHRLVALSLATVCTTATISSQFLILRLLSRGAYLIVSSQPARLACRNAEPITSFALKLSNLARILSKLRPYPAPA